MMTLLICARALKIIFFIASLAFGEWLIESKSKINHFLMITAQRESLF
jgi:hypothetical protein